MTLPSLFFGAALVVVSGGSGLFDQGTLGSPERAVTSPETGASSASCNTECNRKASECIDACEERFKTDDKGRVTCKFECASTRQQCEKNCD